MWILALAKNLNYNKVNCHLVITYESVDQNLELYKRYQDMGLPSHMIKLQGRFDLRVINKLISLIQEQKIDIIHTHGYKSDILGLIAGKIAGIKTIATPHGFENSPNLKLRTYIRLGCMSLRFFDRVSPLSEELYADMRRINIAENKIRLINNGVDLTEVDAELQSAPIKLAYDENEKIIGYVGQIAYRKNIADMIKTFDLLYKEHNNIRLLIIGDGDRKEELENLVKSLPSAAKIEFLGYRKDRLKLVRAMHMFCMTSSLEGIPRCMMEAMALGVPVSAFKISGVDKLIIQGQTGLMAKYQDIHGLKECWKKLLFEERYAQTLAAAGRNHILNNFSAKRMADEYTELYEEMIRFKNKSCKI